MEYTKSNIKRRLVRYVADLWGYQQADMDNFDPLVDLLLGACSVEFERTGNQVISSQSRILEKLAHLLLPESLVTPTPAHLVLRAQSVEPQYTLSQEDQFSADKEVINPAKPTEISKKSVFFSPTLPANIFDANIRYMAMGKQIWEQVEVTGREGIGSGKKGNNLENQELYLGIKLSAKLAKIPALSLFIDWRNHPDKHRFLNLLPVTQISVKHQPLDASPGYGRLVEDKVVALRNQLSTEWDMLAKIEDNTNQLYEKHFLTIGPNSLAVKNQIEIYPEKFAEVFDEDTLKDFKEPLLWLKLSFSQLIPQEAIEDITVALNCFPACNRQLIDNRRPYRIENQLNIIPLKSEDYFLAMHKVSSGDNQPFQALPFYNINQIKPGTYAIRKDRVGKFDGRNAREMLQYVLEMMRDEAGAFYAASGSIGSKEILELEQRLNQIEDSLAKKGIKGDTDQYLMLKPDQAKEVYVSYWNTSGALANKIPLGTSFKTRAVDIKSNSISSLTTSAGGKDQPSEQEKLYTFRSNLLSRGRIVTREDVRAACFAELGESISRVDIQKGYRNASSAKQGLERTLMVTLTPNKRIDLSEEEWHRITEELSQNLEQRSSLFLPINVDVETNVAS